MTTTAQHLISASILRLRMKSPFFATLAMFANFVATQTIETAATDGTRIFYNEEYVRSLPKNQIDGLMLHEVLHAALLHVPRRGERDRTVWNIAADIVVNGIIAQEIEFELPPGGLRNPKLENFTVEEVYELLLQQADRNLPNPDLLNEDPSHNAPGNSAPGNSAPDNSDSPTPENQNQTLPKKSKTELEAHWRNALQQAKIIARSTQAGTIPAGILRELDFLTTPQLDWRSYLWRYLTQTPTDFQHFDRRFIHQGLYLETLSGESIQVCVAVDTSGSIEHELLRDFLSEVRGILNAYPHLKCDLYYADADAYGPYTLDPDSAIPTPEGGGGTAFEPFFEAVEKNSDPELVKLCVYLTDGYGSFPAQLPTIPTLWVVTAGGLDLDQFPFGETVRLLNDR